MDFAAISKFVSMYYNELIQIEGALILLLLVWLVINSTRLRRLSRRYLRLTRGVDENNLYQILEEHINQVQQASKQVDELQSLCEKLSAKLSHAVQRVGIVRFDAFDDVGGNLSFSLSLLDDHSDGVVITGLYGRQDFRCYAKPIRGGESEIPLSKEEKEAIAKALGE